MINYRIIARIFSQVLIFEGLLMLVSAAVSWIYQEQSASSFIYSALITIVTGILVFTPLRNEEKTYGTREGYIIVTGIWLIFSIFSALPFIFTGSADNFSDAFFESMSGFTTTGATIFPDIESLPKGILFWRSLIQWFGGIAIIVISLYVLPVVKTLNIQLSTTEFSGQMTDKIHPKVIETTKRLIFIYFILTLTEAIILIIGKMPLFDAVCHSFSTLSTGGFSTRNNGIAAFPSPFIRIVITIFMFIAGTNMALVYFAIKGNYKKVLANNEFVLYAILVFVVSLIFGTLLHFRSGYLIGNAILNGFFHTISVLTTTGFYTQDYNLWGNFLVLIIFILMFIGGMAGSTSGGIKIIRLLIIAKNNRKELRRLIHPNAYLPVRIHHKTVPQNIVYNLLVFTALYFIILSIGTMVISFMDYDFISSFSASASMLGNIGPGLGSFGPFTNYANLPVAGKWFMCALMLLGRLELLTVIILFTRSFYKG